MYGWNSHPPCDLSSTFSPALPGKVKFVSLKAQHSQAVLEEEAMVTEDLDTPTGWPLGLEIMNLRLRLAESLPVAMAEPFSFRLPSTSFSTLSSSDLDTVSTASFFQDRSVSLGRLIGLRRDNRRRLSIADSIRLEEHEKATSRDGHSDRTKEQAVDIAHGICIPLLFSAVDRMSRSKSRSRR